MFKEGHSQSINNEINGSINNRNFRIFSYNFSVGYGKSKRTYLYTVFCFKYNIGLISNNDTTTFRQFNNSNSNQCLQLKKL
jgi:hypothetical protein